MVAALVIIGAVALMALVIVLVEWIHEGYFILSPYGLHRAKREWYKRKVRRIERRIERRDNRQQFDNDIERYQKTLVELAYKHPYALLGKEK